MRKIEKRNNKVKIIKVYFKLKIKWKINVKLMLKFVHSINIMINSFKIFEYKNYIY